MLGYAPPIDRRIQEFKMGKGDRKTAKGKRSVSSYGNARPHGTTAAVTKTAATPKAAVVKKAAPAKSAPSKAAPAKSAAAKKKA